jgi:hypothetical protein
MQDPLIDNDLWTRRGISLLWDAESLSRLCRPDEVVSVRRFRKLHAADWPDDEMNLAGDTALVVAGLESCMDALPPDEAARWLEETVFPAIQSYQNDFADGGSQAALVFWFVQAGRFEYRFAEDAWYWRCDGEYKKDSIPLSRCLFNGAQQALQEIQDAKERRLGLYHPRIT